MTGRAGAVGPGLIPAGAYDGLAAHALAASLRLPRLLVYDVVGSTMDVAHALAAEGAPAGTVVLADRQTAGRGRQGRSWHSAAGEGVWVTIVERPADAQAVAVLSLRVGLTIADAVEPLAPGPIRLKWPNDLFIGGGKLAGILVEARWREARPDWVAIGVGLNVHPPGDGGGAGLRPGVARIEVLERLAPAVRRAAAATGYLSPGEIATFARRDLALGRRVASPARGVVQGIDGSGGIIIRTAEGDRVHRTGSLVFAEDA